MPTPVPTPTGLGAPTEGAMARGGPLAVQERSPGGLSPTMAEEALARLAGLAPSGVLRRRLDAAAPILATIHGLPAGLSGPPRDGAPPWDSPPWAALLDAVTVQETRFFRAAPQLEALAALLPSLPDPPRLLSAGCATGEEAWTLSVLAVGAGMAAEVVGVDLCRPALAAAGAGRYGAGPPDALREVPAAYLPLFRRDGPWVEAVVPRPAFRRANLLALPEDLGPFAAILCRNVLIYLLPAAREAVLRGLVARLPPGGVLLLGPTDSPLAGLPLVPVPGAPGIWRRT